MLLKRPHKQCTLRKRTSASPSPNAPPEYHNHQSLGDLLHPGHNPGWRPPGRAVFHRRVGAMKMTIDVECTPTEARQFLGLPDLQPMQASILAKLEKRTIAEMDKFSAENMMKLWFSAAPPTAELFQRMFGSFVPQSLGSKSGT